MRQLRAKERALGAPFFDLDSVGAFGHDLGQNAHAEAHRCREAETTGIQRAFCMVFFIDAHLFKDGARLFIFGRQLLKMLIQMLADLMLRRGDKSEADFIADQTCGGADTK